MNKTQTLNDKRNTPTRQQYLKEVIEEMKKQFDNWIEESLTHTRYEFKVLCLLAILDSFSQAYANYNGKSNSDAFENFVMQYQRSWNFLSSIDPVTLFYSVKSKLLSNDHLCYLETDNQIDLQKSNKAVESILVELRKNSVSEENIKTLCNNHKFVKLLYQLRNKASHELSSPSHPVGVEGTRPYYFDMYVIDSQNGNLVKNKVWELIIPIPFICDLVRECCNNYLDDCLNNGEHPFHNNSITRLCKLSWYNKDLK